MAEPATDKAFIDRFLEYLWKHRDDRGMMADLRHGTNSATEYRAWPHLALWCDLTNERNRRIMLNVAAGFAIHGRSVPGKSLADAIHKIATGEGRGKAGLSTFDSRFRRFLTCSTAEEVCDHLPGVLRTAQRHGIPIDFTQLYKDLTYWGERVKVRWAQVYWGGSPSDKEQSEPKQEVL